MSQLVYKQDVFDCLLSAIVRLGKNDTPGCRNAIRLAEEKLERWLIDRPEKEEVEESRHEPGRRTA